MTRREDHQFETVAATRLSRLRVKFLRITPILRLAQGSLLALPAMAFASSCIVADPPQYTDPVRTAPQLNSYLANPSLSQVLAVYPGTTGATFRVEVQSEDAGEELSAVFWEDYNTNSSFSKAFSIQRIPPSSYGAGPRIISSIPFVPAGETGCHPITLLVAHASTFLSSNATELDPKFAPTDAAILTWWVNIRPPADAINTLVNCPTQNPPTQQP